MTNKIKCGKCASEYSPRAKLGDDFGHYAGPVHVNAHRIQMDYSCPVCGHGSLREFKTENKQILLG